MRIRFAFAALALPFAPLAAQALPKPAALVAEGVPEIPEELAAETRPSMEFRAAGSTFREKTVLDRHS